MYKSKHSQFANAYWFAKMSIQETYDFGLIQLDCRKFKKQVLHQIKSLKKSLESKLRKEYMVL